MVTRSPTGVDQYIAGEAARGSASDDRNRVLACADAADVGLPDTACGASAREGSRPPSRSGEGVNTARPTAEGTTHNEDDSSVICTHAESDCGVPSHVCIPADASSGIRGSDASRVSAGIAGDAGGPKLDQSRPAVASESCGVPCESGDAVAGSRGVFGDSVDLIVAGDTGEGVTGGLDDPSRAAVAHHRINVPSECDSSSSGTAAGSAASPGGCKGARGATPQTLSSHQNRSSRIANTSRTRTVPFVPVNTDTSSPSIRCSL